MTIGISKFEFSPPFINATFYRHFQNNRLYLLLLFGIHVSCFIRLSRQNKKKNTSERKDPLFAVLQGSFIRPLLFSIHVSSLGENVNNNNVNMHRYAHDNSVDPVAHAG